MTVDHAMHPGSIEELKAFVSQIEMILPEDKRTAILHTIAQIEASGGIQNETQGQSLLTELMKGLGKGVRSFKEGMQNPDKEENEPTK